VPASGGKNTMNRPGKPGAVQNALAQRLGASFKCAKGVPFPDFIEPMQPTLVPIPPSGDMWLHEIKYDGYRVQVQVQQNGVHFLTRRGHDWTDRFKALAVAASGLKTYAAVLDGEVIVPGPNGTSDFGALQEDLGAKRSDRMVFCAFDVLYLDGLDLRSCPLEDRKRVLAALLKGVNAPNRLQRASQRHRKGHRPQSLWFGVGGDCLEAAGRPLSVGKKD
jgi:bifunctional non-homologous end joining protein LigD